MVDIAPGKLLIADPFLRDPNFIRSVVFICDHKDEGSFGLLLNKQHEQALGELITDLESSTIPVYYGGPVQLDTVHFLHRRPEIITGGYEVTDGIYWGGDFEKVVKLIKANRLTNDDIRFFIGYSGWAEGQLEEEMKQKSWITSEATRDLIFGNAGNTWKDALKELGGEYVQMVNYPIDPQLN
jgi:putative transcriptional regulator